MILTLDPIGISAVRLLRIDSCTLHVADVDILNGTPLLDIKPYAPRFNHLPAERTGWLGEKDHRHKTADRRFEADPEVKLNGV